MTKCGSRPTHHAVHETTYPLDRRQQGQILSPLLANIALSVLDKRFTGKWKALGPLWTRAKLSRQGVPVCRLVRYADDFVVMMRGTRAQAEALRDEISAVLAPMGLRLSVEKTRSVTSTKDSTFWVTASSGDTYGVGPASRRSTPIPPRRRSPRLWPRCTRSLVEASIERSPPCCTGWVRGGRVGALLPPWG